LLRVRLATLLVAAVLGLVCGCMSLSQFPLLERVRARFSHDCCDGTVVPESGGPVVDGPVINGAVPSGPGMASGPSVPSTMPPLTPPPRIAPQPQAQPGPYTP